MQSDIPGSLWSIFPWRLTHLTWKSMPGKRTFSFWNGPFFGGHVNFGGVIIYILANLWTEIFCSHQSKTPRRKLHCSSPTRTSKHQGDLLHVPAMEYIGVLSIPVFIVMQKLTISCKAAEQNVFFSRKNSDDLDDSILKWSPFSFFLNKPSK